MKKGFSLVEISIILLALGILVTITINATSLLDDAKFKKELSRYNTIYTAFSTFETGKGRQVKNIAGVYDTQELIDVGYVKENDVLTAYGTGAIVLTKCAIENIEYGKSTAQQVMADEFYAIGNGADICASVAGSINNHFLCQYELTIEDEYNYKNGRGRALAALTIPVYTDCSPLKGTTDSSAYLIKMN